VTKKTKAPINFAEVLKKHKSSKEASKSGKVQTTLGCFGIGKPKEDLRRPPFMDEID
jgi:hypothetical protein